MAKYRPRHDTQFEPRTGGSPYNCNMAAAADAARFWSLGLIDFNHDDMRRFSGTQWELMDRDPYNNGTNISDAVHALARVGVPAKAYDNHDDKRAADVKRALAGRGVVIAHGDYGSVPAKYRGDISRRFEGTHSVLFHSMRVVDGQTLVLVGDGLDDDWLSWPIEFAMDYMRDFPGTGFTHAIIEPRLLRASVRKANVRRAASRESAVTGRIRPTSSVHYGGTVRGERIGSNAIWYCVFYNGRIGYVHSSVANPR